MKQKGQIKFLSSHIDFLSILQNTLRNNPLNGVPAVTLKDCERKIQRVLDNLNDQQQSVAQKPVDQLSEDEQISEVYRILSEALLDPIDGQRLEEIVRRMPAEHINSPWLWRYGSLPLWIAKTQYYRVFKALMSRPDVSFYHLFGKQLPDEDAARQKILEQLFNHTHVANDVVRYIRNPNYFMNGAHAFGNY